MTITYARLDHLNLSRLVHDLTAWKEAVAEDEGGGRLPRAQGAEALRGRWMRGSADRSPMRRGRCCLLSHTPQAAAGPVMLRKCRRHRDDDAAA